MRSLENLEHRSVINLEETTRDFDPILRSHADEVVVEGSVMDGAHRDAVRHLGRVVVGLIGRDVRRVEELNAVEATEIAQRER